MKFAYYANVCHNDSISHMLILVIKDANSVSLILPLLVLQVPPEVSTVQNVFFRRNQDSTYVICVDSSLSPPAGRNVSGPELLQEQQAGGTFWKVPDSEVLTQRCARVYKLT